MLACSSTPLPAILHLHASATAVMDQVTAPSDALLDHDNETRPGGTNADVGADEFNPNHDLIFCRWF